MLILTDIALYPFGLTSDEIVWWGFVATVIAATSAIWGGFASTIAARLTAKYGKDAPTKKDLARVEENTAHLQDMKYSLKRIDKRDALDALAQQVSITVSGQVDIPQPLTISLTLTNPSVTVERIQLFNEHGNLFGSADCHKANEFVYTASVDHQTLNNWFLGGVPVGTMSRMRLSVRVWMLIDGESTSRQFAVALMNATRHETNGSVIKAIVYYLIEGKV